MVSETSYKKLFFLHLLILYSSELNNLFSNNNLLVICCHYSSNPFPQVFALASKFLEGASSLIFLTVDKFHPWSPQTALNDAVSSRDLVAIMALHLFLSCLSDSIHRTLSNRHSWSKLINLFTFLCLDFFMDIAPRLYKNLAYFHINYIAIFAVVLAIFTVDH